MAKNKIDQVMEKIKLENNKPATVGDLKASETKIMNSTYKIVEAFQKQIRQDNDDISKSMLSEVNTISDVLRGYFTRTDDFLVRIEKQINKNNSDNKKIKKEFQVIKEQIESLGIN